MVSAIAGCVVLAACTPAKVEEKKAEPASLAPPVPTVISWDQADEVLKRGFRQTASARDENTLASLQTGSLLQESAAQLKLGRWPDNLVRNAEKGMYRLEYLIPTERDQPGYPRSFAVLFRMTEKAEKDRAAGLYYFVQAEPGAPWKAAARTWATDRPAPQLPPEEFEDRGYGAYGFDVRDAPIAAPAREPAGAVTLSPTAAADRRVCGQYAEYLTFTAPNGEPESEYFVPGKLTGEVVNSYNDEDKRKVWKGDLRQRYAFEVTGPELPVLRLADGKALVTCSFVRTDHREGKSGPTTSFKYGSEDAASRQTDQLLGGGYKWWLTTDVRRGVTATFEVPVQGPADVVGCNCLNPPVLSAEGTPK
ncbi:hypothetical protein [Streptomyces sp. NBC_00162]|uniref:hypothetical protein n=1 Tax=Streptomyces sp. NBC_00162 TaxID=2903629 RepID=UPI00214C6589|nr:hypothetical protein [Streptomyces sp. NBC_00162]UUU43992.1 hypothetical protein JIW86_37410 [Streptomyces sp. NBC_00162]